MEQPAQAALVVAGNAGFVIPGKVFPDFFRGVFQDFFLLSKIPIYGGKDGGGHNGRDCRHTERGAFQNGQKDEDQEKDTGDSRDLSEKMPDFPVSQHAHSAPPFPVSHL